MDELEKLLGEQLYSQVKTKIGERGLIIDTGMLIPKHRFDCINISLKEHKQKVTAQSERIAELERIAEEVPKLKRRCVEMSDEIIILTEIGKVGVKNILTVRPLINAGERHGNERHGNERHGNELKKSVISQLSRIRRTQPYLFGETAVTYKLVPCREPDDTENNNG